MSSVQEPEGSLPRSFVSQIKKILLGPSRNLKDPQLGHNLSLIAFFAWVGLGADGLSSSAYGPEEAFRALGEHRYLAIFLVLAMAATVFIISAAYSRIIEHFPHGGGGYVVATQLLGRSPGLVSGCALLVDYVLTITVSIASGGDALFSLLPPAWLIYKLPVEFAAIVLLIMLNLRGVKESVAILVPVFLTFVATHFILIGGGILIHLPQLSGIAAHVHSGFQTNAAHIGGFGLFLILLRAYSLGGGTYTGIEAVSNGVGILREPRVATGKRTMFYMSLSLALTAGGLLFCYMLADVQPVAGQTLNTVLATQLLGSWHFGSLSFGQVLVWITIASEAVLLLVAAQTGFIDGPRVMANMASDSWLPRRFAALSDRLTMQNGIFVIGAAALALLAYTRGHIQLLVVMYSINVFLTFSLSQLGMARYFLRGRKEIKSWKTDFLVEVAAFVLCVFILGVMVLEKLTEGAWVTLVLTCLCIGFCFLIRGHYYQVAMLVRDIDKTFENLPGETATTKTEDFNPRQPTAVILVGGYSGLGTHIFLNIFRLFPKTFKNVVFVSVSVVDSDFFKGQKIEAIKHKTEEALQRYVDFSVRMGVPARCELHLGTEVVEEASQLCVEISKKYAGAVFFAGELVFEKPQWYHRLLHNETAYAIQRRIRFAGLPIVILPIRIRAQT